MFLRASCVSLLIWTVGCQSTAPANSDTVEKAQIAVRANPSLELVATDERQSVLTVRVVRGGQIITVNAADVVAGTAFRNLTLDGPADQRAPQVASNDRQPSRPDEQRVSVSRPGAETSVSRSGDRAVVETPGARVTLDTAGSAAAVQRSPAVEAPPESRAAQSAARQEPATPRPGAVIDEGRLERRTAPVQCVGRDVINLKNVLLRVDGVAVAVTGGCEVRIQDSHIVGQTALQVVGRGTVSIDNSIVEGAPAMQLTDGASVSVRSSSIRGQVQRVGNVTLRDEGRNLWP